MVDFSLISAELHRDICRAPAEIDHGGAPEMRVYSARLTGQSIVLSSSVADVTLW